MMAWAATAARGRTSEAKVWSRTGEMVGAGRREEAAFFFFTTAGFLSFEFEGFLWTTGPAMSARRERGRGCWLAGNSCRRGRAPKFVRPSTPVENFACSSPSV